MKKKLEMSSEGFSNSGFGEVLLHGEVVGSAHILSKKKLMRRVRGFGRAAPID